MPISGTIEQVPWNNYVYTDATTGDMIFRSITSNNFLFGFNQNVPSTFNIKASGLFINGASNAPANLNFYRAGQSNASLQLNDMTGVLNFGGRYGASTTSNFASISSLYTGNGVSKSGNIIFSTECNAGMTERMRLTDVGNFGVGTPAPQGLVHMRTARRTPRQVSFNSATAINTWFDTSNLFTKYSSNPWFFETSNNIVCSISLGTSTTATTRSMTSTYNSNGTWVSVPADGSIIPFWASTTAGGAITITELEDSAPIRITDKTNMINALTVLSSNGFVGIGTSNPISTLTVSGGQTIGSSYTNVASPSNGLLVQGGLAIGQSSLSTTTSMSWSVGISNLTYATNQTLQFDSTSITSLGNAFQLSNTSNVICLATGTYSFTGTSNQGNMYLYHNGNTIGNLPINNRPIAIGDMLRFVAWPSGGTFTGGRLSISGTGVGNLLAVGGGQTIGSGYSNVSAPANGLLVQGNVGIGTTSPAQTLHVNGIIQTSNLIVTALSGYMRANTTSNVSVVSTIPSGDIANLDASKITTGTFATALIPNLDGNKITSGTIDNARLPSTISQSFFLAPGFSTGFRCGGNYWTTYQWVGMSGNVEWYVGMNNVASANLEFVVGSSGNFSSGTAKCAMRQGGGNNTNLNFTGQHRCFLDESHTNLQEYVDDNIGLIYVCSGKHQSYEPEKDNETVPYPQRNKNGIYINEAVPTVCLCNETRSQKIIGVLSGEFDANSAGTYEYSIGNFSTFGTKLKGDSRVFINSIGEGGVWIVDENGNLSIGDLIVTSSVPGYGMAKGDNIIDNTVVGKITGDCDFVSQEPDYVIKTQIITMNEYIPVSQEVTEVHTYCEWDGEKYVQKTKTQTRKQVLKQIFDIHDADGNVIHQEEKEVMETIVKEKEEPVLDSNGNCIWEPKLDEQGQPIMIDRYKYRYINKQGQIITKEVYDTMKQNPETTNDVFRAAFVACIYMCG